MAIWQFELLLVPRQAVQQLFHGVPYKIPEDAADSGWWSGEAFTQDDESFLDARLPRRVSWGSKLLTWGTEDGNRVDLYVEGGRIEEATIRIDVREIDSSFLEFTAELAQRWGCLLLTTEFQLVPPIPNEILAALHDSAARRVVKRPYLFDAGEE